MQRRGESLAAGVLAVFSGIHYLAHLKIHQRLPAFQHMGNLNFTASSSKKLSLIWGDVSSTVHQGNAYLRWHMHMICRRCMNRHFPSKQQRIHTFLYCSMLQAWILNRLTVLKAKFFSTTQSLVHAGYPASSTELWQQFVHKEGQLTTSQKKIVKWSRYVSEAASS